MKTYLSVAHAGGQGKTTLAQILYSVLRRRGDEARLVAADHVDENGQSKIGKIFPNKTLELGVGADLNSSKLSNDVNAPLRYWDQLGSVLVQGGAIVDVGANVVSPLIQWARHRRVSSVLRSQQAPGIDVFVSTRAEKHAIASAVNVIQEMTEQDAFPVSNFYMVCNEVGGSFSAHEVSSLITETVPSVRNIGYIKIPRCTSELWGILEKTNTSIHSVLSLSEKDISEKFGIDIWESTAGISDLNSWMDTVSRNIQSAGV